MLKEHTSSLFAKNDRKSGISRAIYELVSHGIREQIKKESVLAMLGELANLHCDIPSILLDIFGILDAETTSNSSTGGGTGGNGDIPRKERKIVCSIVKDTERFLSEKLLKKRLEIDTLQDVGTIKNRSFYSKSINVKTKLQ